MASDVQRRDERGRFRFLPALMISLTLVIFGLTLALVSLHLRQKIREQIAGRDGEVLQAVALQYQFADEAEDGLGALTDHPADLFTVLLKTSRLRGVLVARLFDTEGRFLAGLPENVSEGAVSPEMLEQLRRFRPVSQYHPALPLADLFLGIWPLDAEATQQAPLLVVTIPLHRLEEDRLLGLAQFVIAGHGLAAEFAALDRRLLAQASVAFLTGSLAIVSGLGWAFRRLQRTNRLLSERTASLLRANHELTLAAKTSAVGAVTAHLLHGLKNPLSGLQSFVSSQGIDGTGEQATDWAGAVATTRRMQSLIHETVRILQEEDGVAHYEVGLGELVGVLSARLTPQAQEAGVSFRAEVAVQGALPNREANLILMILENLLQNALEATPPGKAVRMSVCPGTGQVQCRVEDEGPGLPDSVRETLFTPCRTTKPGGSGLGLAISRQLAQHIGAGLALERSSPAGCVFALSLPEHLFLTGLVPRLRVPEGVPA